MVQVQKPLYGGTLEENKFIILEQVFWNTSRILEIQVPIKTARKRQKKGNIKIEHILLFYLHSWQIFTEQQKSVRLGT